MAEVVTATVVSNISVTGTQTREGASVQAVKQYITSLALANGSGAGKVNKYFVKNAVALAADASVSYDLSGSLANLNNETTVFTKVRAIYVKNVSETAATITVGAVTNGLANWITDAEEGIVLAPGGVLLITNPTLAGYGVVNSTGDLLKILNNDGALAAAFDLMVLGE